MISPKMLRFSKDRGGSSSEKHARLSVGGLVYQLFELNQIESMTSLILCLSLCLPCALPRLWLTAFSGSKCVNIINSWCFL